MKTWQDCTWEAPQPDGIDIAEAHLWSWRTADSGGAGRRFTREAVLVVIDAEVPDLWGRLTGPRPLGINWRGYHWRVGGPERRIETDYRGQPFTVTELHLECVFGEKP